MDLRSRIAGVRDSHELWARTINPQFVRVLRTIGFDRTWARAEGAYLYDADGARYLDLLGGFGMYGVGRNNPRVRAALVEALGLETPVMLAMVTTLVVWGAVPFVTITLYAALTQVPRELVEAAEIDGATAWRVFRDITVPVIMPALLILTSLSIIWDFGVFTQAYLLIGAGHIIPQNYLMGIYLFQEGYVKTDFGRGATISILMLLIVALMSVVYVRRMVRLGDAA